MLVASFEINIARLWRLSTGCRSAFIMSLSSSQSTIVKAFVFSSKKEVSGVWRFCIVLWAYVPEGRLWLEEMTRQTKKECLFVWIIWNGDINIVLRKTLSCETFCCKLIRWRRTEYLLETACEPFGAFRRILVKFECSSPLRFSTTKTSPIGRATRSIRDTPLDISIIKTKNLNYLRQSLTQVVKTTTFEVVL